MKLLDYTNFIKNIFKLIINTINQFLESQKKLTNFLVVFFDYGSQLTSFVLFNFFGFFFYMCLLFFIPVYFGDQLMDFLLKFKTEPNQVVSCFWGLPFPLKSILIFYFCFIELVCFCTLLAAIPVIKQGMISRYNDPEILKKRHYNMLNNSLRRVTITGLPLTAGIIVLGDSYQNAQLISAIERSNAIVWQEYRRTGNQKLLKLLETPPKGTFTTQIREVSVNFMNKLVTWKSGSTTKD